MGKSWGTKHYKHIVIYLNSSLTVDSTGSLQYFTSTPLNITIEAERLHELINDILLLSEIETKLKDTNLEIFDLKSMVDDVFKVMQNIAKEKKISLNNNVRDEVLMKANINRMKQLIMNLVDNGIKYNVQNGSVSVDGYREDGKVVISVKDTE